MKCNNDKCGMENPKDALFCMYCGSPLPAHTTCPHCGNEISNSAKFCSHCGKEIKPSNNKGWKDLFYNIFKWLTIWFLIGLCYCQFSYTNFKWNSYEVQNGNTSAYRCDMNDKYFSLFKSSTIDYDKGRAFMRAHDEYREAINNYRALFCIVGGYTLLLVIVFKYHIKKSQTKKR